MPLSTAVSSGPAMNPRPKDMPMRPKFCARFSGGLTSAMYAAAVPMEAPHNPATRRPRKNQASDGANASST